MPTSPKNTSTARNPKANAEVTFDTLKGDKGEDAIDEAKAALEAQLSAEKDARNEERFIWIVVCTILVNVIWFRNASNPVLPLVILVLELLVLVVVARRMGIDDIVSLVDRLLHSVGRGAGGGQG
jgi:hypothetical protein